VPGEVALAHPHLYDETRLQTDRCAAALLARALGLLFISNQACVYVCGVVRVFSMEFLAPSELSVRWSRTFQGGGTGAPTPV
jgi:hypothetical protein